MSDRNRFMSSSNPFVSENRLERASQGEFGTTSEGSMTVQGAVNKTLVLTAILLCTAVLSWNFPNMGLFYAGLFGGLIAVLIGIFKPTTAPITAPIYAACEGIVLGMISLIYAVKFEGSAQMSGIVLNAILLTMLCLGSMLVLYKTGVIQPTEKFKSVIFTATAAIGMVYLSSMLLGLFGIQIPYLHQGGVIGIVVSLVIVVVASLNLIIDFEQFEVGEEMQAPKYMEWSVAMGLLVTLVWLYIELLRLLSKFKSE